MEPFLIQKESVGSYRPDAQLWKIQIRCTLHNVTGSHWLKNHPPQAPKGEIPLPSERQF